MSATSQLTPELRSQLKILIVDDHALLNETLKAVLERSQGISTDTLTSVDEAVEAVSRNGRYDAMLVDYDGPGMAGLDGLKTLVAANEGAVALFSGVANWSIVERAIKAGASGFIPKTLPTKTLGHAIRFIADGEVYLPSDYIMQKPASGDKDFGLKPREARVLGLLCEGLQNKEIGSELEVEETTVKMDVKAICRKLGVRNRTEAVIKAFRHGLGQV